MKHSIFIRSYYRDLKWLEYCLRSIRKNWTDHADGEVVVCFPNSDMERYGQEIKDRVESSHDKVRLTHWSDSTAVGYIDQQVNKVYADIFCSGYYIIFVDSDCFLTKSGGFSEFFVGDSRKPYLLHTDYKQVGDAICWKECTEELIGHPVSREYMRRIPMVVKREHLLTLREYLRSIHGRDPMHILSSRNRMSEFNLIGAYLFDNHRDEYQFLPTEACKLPETAWVQNWSHTNYDELSKKLEAML